MHIAKVIGTVVATRKVDSLRGCKFLVVQPLDTSGRETGRPLVAVDTVRGYGFGGEFWPVAAAGCIICLIILLTMKESCRESARDQS